MAKCKTLTGSAAKGLTRVQKLTGIASLVCRTTSKLNENHEKNNVKQEIRSFACVIDLTARVLR